jgi:hypothetical protein
VKTVIAAAAAACLAAYVIVYATGLAPAPIRSDGFSYYVYLPSWFLYHDTTLAAVADDCCGGEFPDSTAIIRWPGTQRWVDAHPIGVAAMQTPFFAVAHALTRWTNLSPDGFTLYYQHAAGLAGLFWAIAGLAVLGTVLRRHHSSPVAAFTIVTILFGTNLFHYATFDSSYSHAYSFFLFAAFLAIVERWNRDGVRRPVAARTAFLMGAAAGLIILVRHTNALLLVCFAPVLRRDARAFAIAAAALLFVVAPQLALYYQATGRPLVSSYGELGFNFMSPQIAGVLLSTQKGLFFWSPVLLLACAGFVMLAQSPRSPAREFLIPALAFLAVDTYVIASWWDWQFGGSFGHRGFVDALPLFAVGLAAFFAWSSVTATRRAVVVTLVICAVALNMFQMAQYWRRVLPFSDTTWDQYRAVFLRWH